MNCYLKRAVILIPLVLSLQGCFFVVGAAAGAAGVAAVYDHRKLSNIMQDQHTTQIIYNNIRSTPSLLDSHIEVTCFNQIVLLTGETATADQRALAGAIAQRYPNVSKVYNQITVRGPTSSLTRASDSWISAKIKTEMLATSDLKSGTIKVLTENGTVYLLGIVTRDQADMAVDIARQVSGVQKVVKIFQYKN